MDRFKQLKWFLFLGSLLGLVLLCCFRNDGIHLSEYQHDSGEWDVIKAARQQTKEPLVQKISFNGFDLFADEENSAFYYSLIEKNRNAFDPLIRISAESDSVRVMFSEDVIDGSMISQNSPLRLLAYDDESYREYLIYVTTLPLLSVESEIEYIHGTGKDRDLKLTLFDNRYEARQRLLHFEGLIHIRGVSSSIFPKLAYKMEFFEKSPGKNKRDANRSLLGMREDNEWILYAGYDDQERIRNVFSSELWFSSCAGANEFGVQNGNEYRFVELFMNGKYWGLYALGTPLDAKQMKPLKKTENVQNVFVFKKSFWSEVYSDLPEGTLMRDYEARGNDTLTHEDFAREILRDYDSFAGSGAFAKSFDRYTIHADLQNAVDTWLFVLLVQGMDTVSSNGEFINMFLTFIQEKADVRAIYTPWDLDLTWGNFRSSNAKNNTLPYGLNSTDNSYVMLRNPANALLQSDPQQIIRRYRVLRESVWSDERIQNLIDTYESKIFDSGAYLRDIQKWPDSSSEDPALKLSVFSDYVHRRFLALDEFVERLGK